jgi:hypothetical protein
MRCDEARASLAEVRYGVERSPELDAHLAGCAACAACAAREAALDRALGGITPAVVSPGFDASFLARLAEERAQARRRSYARLAWALPLAAAGVLFVLRPAPPRSHVSVPSKEELGLVMELDMVRNLDVVSKLDEIEAFDVLSELDEAELAQLSEDKPEERP